MNGEERIKNLQNEFRQKLDFLLEKIEANHAPGKLDGGNQEINALWKWYREEMAKIRKEI